MTNLEKQVEFQNLACQEIPAHREVPSIDVRLRRLILDLEETGELAEGFGLGNRFAKMMMDKATEFYLKYPKPDPLPYKEKDVLDALIDKEVINNGSIIECGLKNIYQENYDLVNENNMTKCCHSPGEAEETVSKYTLGGTPCSYKKVVVDGAVKYVVKRRADGKLLKPLNFKPVQLNIK